MAIQAWTGSGVVGPIDVVAAGISEARARRCTGQGELGWALLGLVGGGPGLGGLGCANGKTIDKTRLIQTRRSQSLGFYRPLCDSFFLIKIFLPEKHLNHMLYL